MDKSSSCGSSARDLLTVDLRGLKAALAERAKVRGISVSALVRGMLTDAGLARDAVAAAASLSTRRVGDRARVSLRLSREDAEDLGKRAAIAGLPIGTYVSELMRGAGAPMTSAERQSLVGALTRSNAELSTMSRNIAHLTALLRQGAVRAAQEYREALDTLEGDVRTHLALAAQLLADPSLHHRAPNRRNPHA